MRWESANFYESNFDNFDLCPSLSIKERTFICQEENKEIMRTYEQVVKMTENPGILGTIVDARPAEDYNKKIEADPAKTNHIPTSKSVPLNTLIDTNTGLLKKPEELKECKSKTNNLETLSARFYIVGVILSFKYSAKLESTWMAQSSPAAWQEWEDRHWR